MVTVPVADFLPDYPDYQNPGATLARNVIPGTREGIATYRPFPAFLAYTTSALTARCQGAWYGQESGGAARVFFGDAGKLYTLSGTTPNDVSKAATTYATPSDGGWRFETFGDLLVATNGVDTPQKFDLTDVIDGSVKFVDLGGTPPQLPYLAVVGGFLVFAGGITVQWSSLENAESYTGNQADTQVMPSGGLIRGIVGGQNGILFQRNAIRRLVPGDPTAFIEFQVIANQLGCDIPGSIAAYGDAIFFVHRSGFYRIDGTQSITPIGNDRVNRWFWSNVDMANLHRVSSAIDFVNEVYAISFPSTSASGGTPDTILFCQYTKGRWSMAKPGDHETIFTAASQTSYDLDTDMSVEDQNLDSTSLPSLDSEIYTGVARPLLGASTTSHYIAFSNGSNLEATIDTAEQQLTRGAKSRIRAARPLVDGGAPTVALGVRDNLQDSVSWTSAESQSSNTGLCRFRVGARARYHRARITVPAGASWTHCMGLDDVEVIAAGRR